MLLSKLFCSSAGAAALRKVSHQEPPCLRQARAVLLCARSHAQDAPSAPGPSAAGAHACTDLCYSVSSSGYALSNSSWPWQRGSRRGARYSPWHQQHVATASSKAGEGSSSDVSSDDVSNSDVSSSSSGSDSSNSGKAMVLNLPTMLTIGRVAAIPFLVAAWYWPSPSSTTAVTSIFIAASLTDWLDGYLARKMNTTSPFGAFLDPVADKLMVSTLLVLLSTQPLPSGPFAGINWLVPACAMVIIGREITISALREWAATLGSAARDVVAVNTSGKWKTAAQMTALTLLLIARDGGSSSLTHFAATAGPALLLVSAYLTLQSMITYMRAIWRFL